MFHTARIKLTSLYLTIIMLVSISFSIGMYKILTNEVERFSTLQRFRIERELENGNFLPPAPRPNLMFIDPDLENEVKLRISYMLVVINAVILVSSGLLGYFLAGKTLNPIKQMVDEQNRFITDASHEIRTPLTALKSSMEVYLREGDPSKTDTKELIKDSMEEVEKLKSLSDSLLQLAQYQKPNESSEFEIVSIGEIAKQSVLRINKIATLKKINILNSVVDTEIEANKYSLNDLIVILLDNAVKYSKDGQDVMLTSETNDGFVYIKVKDTGVGIDPKDLPHVFERFYRSTDTKEEGYGLGLSIAKRIVDIHKGNISVESIPNTVTTFTVKLPIKQNMTFTKSIFS